MKHMRTNRPHPPSPFSQDAHVLTQEETSCPLVYWNSHQESILSFHPQNPALVCHPERDCIIGF